MSHTATRSSQRAPALLLTVLIVLTCVSLSLGGCAVMAGAARRD